jgi:hypothetical protein
MSPGRQVLSNQGSSGPYSRKIANQPFFGTVAIQLASLPAGAFGPIHLRKHTLRTRYRFLHF